MIAHGNTINGLVYIDESGNPGFTGKSSEFFVMVAVVMSEAISLKMNNKIAALKKELGLSAEFEFKFSGTKKQYVKNILEEASRNKIEIFTVIYKKKQYRKIKRGELYNSVLLELLKTIRLSEINVEIDGRVGEKYHRQTKTFVRKNITTKKIKRFRYVDSKSSNLIQLADLIAGAVARSLTDKKDAGDYFRIIK